MAQRAAIVTGASSGIGRAIARMLAEEGYGLTVASRRADRLTPAADELRGMGADVVDVPADMGSEDDIKAVVTAHRDQFGRLDVLINNAGIGLGAPVAEITTKRLDVQLDVNIRSIVLFYRECVELLRAAGAEHRQALVVNTASVAGKRGQAWLSVYSATKFAVVGFTESMNKELSNDGIKSCALCPGFVNTAMTDFIKDTVDAEAMIQPEDVAEGVRYLLKVSPGCLIPEIVFNRPGEVI
jgi:NAD(P)-dependent dehydrogenase (short-subunit alcohol dehydrogenase family)